MERNKLKVKVGDTVIRKDGLKGKVTLICDCSECKKRGFFEMDIAWENGREDFISSYQASVNFKDYYLIGHTVLGNKAKEGEIESTIKCVDYQIEELKAKKKQLRKQLWRLREEMVEDWKERRQARMNKKENQPSEEDTED